jgi:pimeloyl-ACP methyl ester carboxylesterase
MRLMHWLIAATLVLIASAVIVSLLADRDVRARNEALARDARSVQGRHGAIEYATWGEGAPVLVIHGAGGGFDQGRLIAEAFGGEDVRWIAISRFGYLGSALPPDASTAAQADAIVDLLDALGIERISVLAFSGGAPPALQFAERYPERVERMALLSSAPFTPFTPPTEARPIPDWLYQALFGNDAVYWTLSKLAPGMLEQAFDARADLRNDLPESEAQFVTRLVGAFLPASRRLAGVMNEGAAIAPDARYALETIRAPTLVVHARDDRLNQFAVGEALAARIPGAAFMPLDAGGHLLLGHHAKVRARVASFLSVRP